jgi:hypothetical protein
MMLNKLDQKTMSCKYFFPFFCSVIHDKMVGMSLKLRNLIICPSKYILVLILGNSLYQICNVLFEVILKEALLYS